MYARLLKTPAQSAFVFGPRTVGKSTWIRSRFPQEKVYDLLDTSLFLDLSREPSTLYRELSRSKPGSWAVIDEIQRIPALLNEVHRLIEDRSLNFVMTGSSARKLRTGGTNLLAGRAISLSMFPITSAELEFNFDLDRVLHYGTLPVALNSPQPHDYLRSYVETYLTQEVLAEAVIRNVGNFARFTEVAARQNAQPTNVTNIARDVGIGRQTVSTHFDILSDTLVGNWLRAWKLKSSNKQLQQSKFYFFDTGVVRGLSRRLPFPATPEERGILLETFVFNELRAFLSYSGLHYPLNYWRSYDGAEVDFVVETTEGFVGIEVKSSDRWTNKFNRGFRRFAAVLSQESRFSRVGVFTGSREVQWDDVVVFPIKSFLQKLWNREIVH